MKSILFLGVILSSCFITARGQEADTVRHRVLDSVVVFGDKHIRSNSVYQFTPMEAKQMVSVIGETDVLRYIASLPGVSQGMEGGMGFFVRGGNSGNNRVELDEVPLYGSTHLFGLFSVFPPDIVENMDFRTGKIPAKSGDFLASLARITSINPDREKYHAKLSLSPFLFGANVSGPVCKKITFQLAGRISLLKPEYELIKSMTEAEGDVNPEVADIYVKINYYLHNRHTISVGGYLSNDYFAYTYDNVIEMNWGNKLLRASWDWKPTEHLQLNTIVYFNNFYSGQRQKSFLTKQQTGELRLRTALNELATKTALSYNKRNVIINTGIQAGFKEIKPASEKILVKQNDHTAFDATFRSNTFSVFGDVEYKYKFLTTSLGLRACIYQINEQNIFDGNIRAAVSAELSKKIGIELSYDDFSQFHHVVEGLPVGWSLDLIIPSDKTFLPEKARQLYIGGYWANKNYHFAVGAYYKKMNNLVSYKNGANIFGVQNTNWQEEITMGKGSSYGMESRFEKKGEMWNTALSYTLSKSDRQFADINNGETFPSKFDRRHIVNFTSQLLTLNRPKRKQYFNVGVSFSSGNNVTIPIAMYKGITPPFWEQRDNGIYVGPKQEENALYRQLMSSANGYSVPNYFRIDVGYNFLRTGKRFTSDLTIGIFNILNRQNPYLIFYEDGQWKQLSIFPIIPSIKWTVGF